MNTEWGVRFYTGNIERVAELIPASDKRVDVYTYTQDAPGGVLAGLAHRRYARPAVAARDIARWLA